MEVICSSKTLITTYKMTASELRRYDQHLHSHENLISPKFLRFEVLNVQVQSFGTMKNTMPVWSARNTVLMSVYTSYSIDTRPGNTYVTLWNNLPPKIQSYMATLTLIL
jgi:hypothetical protein